jgi:uncharacterized membrane protein
MTMRTGRDRWSNGLFWAAISITAVSGVGRGHDRMLDFVMGAAGAIFVVSLGRFAQCRLRQQR